MSWGQNPPTPFTKGGLDDGTVPSPRQSLTAHAYANTLTLVINFARNCVFKCINGEFISEEQNLRDF